jgi:hypothetical protein
MRKFSLEENGCNVSILESKASIQRRRMEFTTSLFVRVAEIRNERRDQKVRMLFHEDRLE